MEISSEGSDFDVGDGEGKAALGRDHQLGVSWRGEEREGSGEGSRRGLVRHRPLAGLPRAQGNNTGVSVPGRSSSVAPTQHSTPHTHLAPTSPS